MTHRCIPIYLLVDSLPETLQATKETGSHGTETLSQGHCSQHLEMKET